MRAVLRHERDLLDVKARLGHRVAGLGPHGGKRPEALDAGMDEICFTDHVEPLTWGSNELRPPYDWSGLTADFANVQAALGDRIHLRLGMEGRRAEGPGPHEKAVGGRAAV